MVVLGDDDAGGNYGIHAKIKDSITIMAKIKSIFQCQSCGAIHPRWQGQCDACGEWNSIVEETPSTPTTNVATKKSRFTLLELSQQQSIITKRYDTGNEELNRVLGGGLTVGSVVLIGGEPGIGKSTLLLQAVINMSEHLNVAYLTGEESLDQIAQRAVRLQAKDNKVMAAHTVYLNDVLSIVIIMSGYCALAKIAMALLMKLGFL